MTIMWEKICKAEKLMRPGQLGALLAARAHFVGVHRHQIAQIQLPTGYGKTLVMLLASQLFSEGKQTLVVCSSEVLREQTAHSFKGYLNDSGFEPPAATTSVRAREILKPRERKGLRVFEKVGVNDDGSAAVPDGVDLVVAHPQSLQTYARSAADQTPKVGLILVDEGHHLAAKTWARIVENHPGAKVIVFTATPFRGDGRLVPGRLVFSYSLADAIGEGAISNSHIEALDDAQELHTDTDQAIASAGIRRLKTTLREYSQAQLLAKCGNVEQAAQIAELYRNCKGAPYKRDDVLLLHSQLTRSEFSVARQRLDGGDFKIVVAVDMLAEGVDIPSIRILTVHARLPELTHFVQVAGRVSRALGDAGSVSSHIVLLKSALPEPLQPAPPRNLHELTGQLHAALEREELKAQLYSYLADGDIPPDDLRRLVEAARLREHAKVVTCANDESMDWEHVEELGGAGIVGHHTAVHVGGRLQAALIAIPQRTAWLDELATPALLPGIVMTYEPGHRAGTRRQVFFMASVEARPYLRLLIAQLDPKGDRLRPAHLASLKKVFSGKAGVSYYNVGLRSRLPSPLVEKYRIAAGPEVERTLNASASYGFQQGHVMGRLFEVDADNGEPDRDSQELLGVSASGTIWGVQTLSLDDLLSWINTLTCRIAGTAQPTTSALESIPQPLEADFSALAAGNGIGAFWGIKTMTEPVVLRSDGLKDIALSTLTLDDVCCDPASGTIRFKVVADTRTIEVALMHSGAHFECRPEAEVTTSDGKLSLARWLAEDPPLLFLADGTCVHGTQVVAPPEGGSDVSYLQDALFTTDWSICDICMEKPPGFEPDKQDEDEAADADTGKPAAQKNSGADKASDTNARAQTKAMDYDPFNPPADDRSIFKLVALALIAKVKHGELDVALCDDDAGELADFVAARRRGDGVVTISLYLCKASKTKKPGFRTIDVQELWAQALRVSQLLTRADVLKHIDRRHMGRIKMADDMAAAKQRLVDLITEATMLEFEIILVQPGLALGSLTPDTIGRATTTTTIPHAFGWLHGTFGQRGVRLMLVGSKTAKRKQKAPALKAAVNPSAKPKRGAKGKQAPAAPVVAQATSAASVFTPADIFALTSH
ncbi:hypothetical protein D2W70_21660 [Burkholderia pseudomallei]|nr:hypothetical protein D2W70_21660 [Burkholderia pseudomallei]RIV63818.1 hypothetical protein D2W49_08795 [Burkholderia pseudomallei]